MNKRKKVMVGLLASPWALLALSMLGLGLGNGLQLADGAVNAINFFFGATSIISMIGIPVTTIIFVIMTVRKPKQDNQ